VRLAAYVVLVALAIAAVFAGELWIALVLGGAKALLVAFEYMELRHAARAHAVVFALGMVVLVVGLVVIGG
jgi:hypothetical protein